MRVAAVWCAMNLSWADSANLAAASVRVAKLRELGFDRKMARMVEDPDLDVRDRAKTALEMMDRFVDEVSTTLHITDTSTTTTITTSTTHAK